MDPFENANEAKTAEFKFCIYPWLSLSNKDQTVSRLANRENEESQNHEEHISSYNQLYADALLTRQLQDEESNSLEQRLNTLIKKRDLMNCSKKLTFNSHYIQTPYDHEQTIWIGTSSYDSDKTRRQKRRGHHHTFSHECCNPEQISPDHGGNGYPPSSHNGSSISRDSEVSSVYTCFVCGTDGHISRFCSQMQSLADHGPHNNILYPYGLQLLVNGTVMSKTYRH